SFRSWFLLELCLVYAYKDSFARSPGRRQKNILRTSAAASWVVMGVRGQPAMAWNSGDPERLNFQEVQNSLAQMSAADLRRAERIAGFLAHGLPGTQGEDLLQEVYIKLLSGDR